MATRARHRGVPPTLGRSATLGGAAVLLAASALVGCAPTTIPPGPDNPLGRRGIGFASGYGWQIGFHGTPHPELLGQAVSHGCVRMRNDDVVKVYERVRVGTVVIVQP